MWIERVLPRTFGGDPCRTVCRHAEFAADLCNVIKEMEILRVQQRIDATCGKLWSASPEGGQEMQSGASRGEWGSLRPTC